MAAAIETPDHPFWIKSADGTAIDFRAPAAASFDIVDIATALANICRYNGQLPWPRFYSVATHSWLAWSMASPMAKPYALLHDWHEAYCGDMTSPLKSLLRHLGNHAFDETVERMDAAFFPALGLRWPWPDAIKAEVKMIDEILLATELRDFKDYALDRLPPAHHDLDLAPYGYMPRQAARRCFLFAVIEEHNRNCLTLPDDQLARARLSIAAANDR